MWTPQYVQQFYTEASPAQVPCPVAHTVTSEPRPADLATPAPTESAHPATAPSTVNPTAGHGNALISVYGLLAPLQAHREVLKEFQDFARTHLGICDFRGVHLVKPACAAYPRLDRGATIAVLQVPLALKETIWRCKLGLSRTVTISVDTFLRKAEHTARIPARRPRTWHREVLNLLSQLQQQQLTTLATCLPAHYPFISHPSYPSYPRYPRPPPPPPPRYSYPPPPPPPRKRQEILEEGECYSLPPPPPPPRCLQQSPGARVIPQYAHVAAAGGVSNPPLTRAGGNSAAVSTSPVLHRAAAQRQQVVQSCAPAANAGASGSGSGRGSGSGPAVRMAGE